MENKIIKTGDQVQSKIIQGVNKSVEAIVRTLGPAGKNVAFDDQSGNGVQVTRDGATVAKNIKFKDQEENFGAELVRKAAALTEEKAGDSTSTTALLIREFCRKGQKAVNTGANVNEIKAGMLKAGKWVTDYIKTNSIAVDGDLEKIRKVATISANNDPVVGDIVVSGMEKVGIHGLITVDASTTIETSIEVTTGMKLERGWASPHFVTSPADGRCVLEHPVIAVLDEHISSVQQVINLLTAYQDSVVKSTGNPLLIVCNEIDDSVLSMLVYNVLSGALKCCVVKGVDFGDGRKNIMEDLSVATGATHICAENNKLTVNFELEDFGRANKVVIDRNNCVIYEGAGDQTKIQERANILSSRLKSKDISNFDKTKFEKRLANLTGGIAVIKAGGASEVETFNMKATIEDSVLAAKCAVEEGCLPGGGYIFFQASRSLAKDNAFWKSLNGDETEGAKIIVDSLPIVLKTIAENSGVSGEVVLENVSKKKPSIGFNAKTKEYVSLVDSGVLDSAKAVRVALENSISAASMILLIDCTITVDETSEKKED